MLNSYSNIKRYNLKPEFLLRSTRNVICHYGWTIHKEIESNIVAIISNGHNTPLLIFKVNVHRGYLTLSCKNECDTVLQYYFDNRDRVHQFIYTLDNHLMVFPAEDLQKHHESFGHCYKTGNTSKQVFNN